MCSVSGDDDSHKWIIPCRKLVLWWCDAFFVNVSIDNAASEGVLASFFNSLLSKKTGSPGSPGAGGVQSTAKKSGQKTVLTNVQEELDRMTRKPDSMVTNSSTENEAWSSLKSAYVKWPNNYVYWSAKTRIFLIWHMLSVFWGRGDELKIYFSDSSEYEMHI